MKTIDMLRARRRCLLWLFVVLPILIPNSPLARKTTDEIYYYRSVTGDTEEPFKWRLHKASGFTLTYQSARERHVTITGPDYDTRNWQVIDEQADTRFSARRTDNTIVIDGRHKGKPLMKSLAIDGAPWYQATSLSLRELIGSDDSQRIFWTIRPDTLTAHKIRATKKGTETRTRPGGPESLLRIRLTLPGMLAPFWKSDYWFSLPTGVFFRYEGPSGPPGSPMTVVTRIRGVE